MILTDIQIQSLIVCAALLLAVILVGYTMIRMEIREEREKRRRIVRRLNHERNYGRER